MYLKSIEIHGFKSFANKIKLDFHNGITGIVDPNGSGKSNVADAVRWVLGEQRTKQLRGSSMQDVIFAGTELRKPLGYAFVSITLDNTDHALAIEYDEVTVSRRLYRSGESEYMINGAGCRLKDINELFYDTGIGKEGYSIIGQGQIDQILSSKPEDRRALFDEAAGIVKFKLRKDAAIKKLEDEKQNLIRLNDILSEIEKQIGPLEKQSEVAKIYLRDKEQLKKLDVNCFLLDSAQQRTLLGEADEKYEIAGAALKETQEKYDDAKTEYDAITEELSALDKAIEEAREQMTESSVMKEKLEGQIGILKEQIRSATGQDGHFKNRRETLTAEIAETQKTYDTILKEKEEIEKELSGFLSTQEEVQEKQRALTGQIEALNETIETKKSEILETLSARAGIKSKLSSLDTMRQQANIRKAELTGRLVQARSDESAQEEAIRKFREIFDAVSAEIETMNETQAGAEKELSGIKETLSACDDKLRAAQAGYHSEKSKLDALTNLTERYEGYGGSVKRVMERKGEVKGIIGVVADIIKTDKEYENAIEVALGASIQNVVTDNEDTAKKLIAYLKETRGGRATFLPLTEIKNAQEFKQKEALSEAGVIGLADSLVQTEDRYRDVATSLLGRIIVVDHIDHAIALQRKFKHGLRIVTVQGELLTPGGAISGGAFKNSSNLLGRRRELEALEKAVKRFEQEAKDAQDEIERTKSHRNDLRRTLEDVRAKLQEKFIEQNTARMNLVNEEEKQKEQAVSFSELQDENESLTEQLEEIAKQKEEAEEALRQSEQMETDDQAAIEKAQEELKLRTEEEKEVAEQVNARMIETEKIRQKLTFEQENLDRVGAELSAKQTDLTEVERELQTNEEALQQKQADVEAIMKTIEASIDAGSDAKALLEQKLSEKENLTARQGTFFTTREALSEQMSSLDKEVTRLDAQRTRLREAIEHQIDYMWNEYEITLSDAEQMKDPALTDVSAMKREIAALKDAIRKLGDVNVNAIEDYKNLMERYTFMKTQHDDLVQAEEQLRGIIEELDGAMRTQFTEQFARINTSFNEVFREMFGGGKGELELVADEDILTAGIRIIAQPPGKKLQNMMQLSGGEKALTAIALLFAIQKLKPSPFCLLDEIEAALDENNVVRFAKYLHKLRHTQFIVITHRRGTMESADRLYGITMQEKGVSALVSVNLIDNELED